MSGNAPEILWNPTVERNRTIYKRLETDEEFRQRLIDAGHGAFKGRPYMKRSNESDITYKTRTRRIGEDDYSWIKRVNTPMTTFARELYGEDLDNTVWDALRIQRRIIEVFE